MYKLLSCFVLALVLSACSQEQEQVVTTPLLVSTSNGEIRFNVEVAQTPEQLKTGLMHRTKMPLNNGMIFSIYPVRPTAMWMKNTKMSLDMLFVAPDARISQIEENATPLSEELIISREPVRAVIELNAGQVSRYGIKVGDKINHKMFESLTTLSDTQVEADTLEDPKKIQAKNPVPVVPDSPNIAIDGAVMPKGPNASGNGAASENVNAPILPKGPNANPNGIIYPKGPNANPNAIPVPSPM